MRGYKREESRLPKEELETYAQKGEEEGSYPERLSHKGKVLSRSR